MSRQAAPRPDGIDWDGIRRRLAAAQAALDGSGRLSSEEEQRKLVERAVLMARVPTAARANTSVNVVEFLLSRERHAVEVEYVEEVCQIKALTRLPGTPPFMAGVFNLRGTIISVLDLKQLFGLPEQGLTNHDRVVILARDGMRFGLLTDGVQREYALALDTLLEPVATMTGLRRDFLKGTTGEGTILLDGGALLADRRLLVNHAGT